jgi:hypothetical protein
MVRTNQGNRLLQNAYLSEKTLELPSWVPDWSLQDISYHRLAPHSRRATDENPVAAARGDQAEIKMGDSPLELSVELYGIDVIEDLGDIREYQDDPPVRCGKDHDNDQETTFSPEQVPFLFRYVMDIMSFVETSPAYTEEERVDIVWRTAACDREVNLQRKAPSNYLEHFLAYLEDTQFKYQPRYLHRRINDHVKRLRDSEELKKRYPSVQEREAAISAEAGTAIDIELETARQNATIFQRAAINWCLQLRVAMTETGLVGMVPHRTEEGDYLAVIKGVSVPMILRKVDEDKVIIGGQAYFYGFMNGEVLDSDKYEKEFVTIV